MKSYKGGAFLAACTNNHEKKCPEGTPGGDTSAAYSDDVNYTVAGRKNEDLLPRVSKLIKDNRTYCWRNYLKINEDKNLIVVTQHFPNQTKVKVSYQKLLVNLFALCEGADMTLHLSC